MAEFTIQFNAKTALKRLRGMPARIKRVEKNAITRTSKRVIQSLQGALRRGRPLQSRSGDYVKSITMTKFERGKNFIQRRVITRGLVYPIVHEEGRKSIQPKSKQFLAIPLPAARNSKGKSMFKSPLWESLGAAFGRKNIFSRVGKSGKKVIYRKTAGGGVIPLYVLKKSVKIKKRPLWKPTATRFRPVLIGEVNRELAQVLRETR